MIQSIYKDEELGNGATILYYRIVQAEADKGFTGFVAFCNMENHYGN